MSEIIKSFAEIAEDYDAIFCDLWGCLHNGKQAFPAAVAALQAYRAKGGIVVLVTNAPRPAREVVPQLARLNAPVDCYDLIATSGDAAQDAVRAGLYGKKVYHLGPSPKDDPFFHNDDGTPLPVERVALAEAESIICTGLFDDRSETPDDYGHTILSGVNRGLTMLCANPDLQVDIGETRIYCAGAIAKAYEEAGGTAHYYGKPHPPIYALARQKIIATFGREVPDARILCVGDGILTDVPGAMGENLDCLFVTGGLAAAETGTTADQGPDPARLADFLATSGTDARYSIGYLR